MPSSDFQLHDWSENDRLQFVAYASGAELPPNAIPWSQNYSGYQFGIFAQQLGDGRAISLGEFQNAKQEIWEIQLKGAGNTPYSRMGDGFAVLRSSIREFLVSEHFHALGIPTSRAAALVTTGQLVHRETLEPGAIVTRLAPSWIRFGTFERFSRYPELPTLAQLTEFTLRHFFPSAQGNIADMFKEVVRRTALLMAKWDLAAWTHGVLNTDNMSVLGFTIDYGPFAFLDAYEPDFIANHSDVEGRYTLRHQKDIGLWNLGQLGLSWSELIGRQAAGQKLSEVQRLDPEFVKSEEGQQSSLQYIMSGKEKVISILKTYSTYYEKYYLEGMRAVCTPCQ